MKTGLILAVLVLTGAVGLLGGLAIGGEKVTTFKLVLDVPMKRKAEADEKWMAERAAVNPAAVYDELSTGAEQ